MECVVCFISQKQKWVCRRQREVVGRCAHVLGEVQLEKQNQPEIFSVCLSMCMSVWTGNEKWPVCLWELVKQAPVLPREAVKRGQPGQALGKVCPQVALREGPEEARTSAGPAALWCSQLRRCLKALRKSSGDWQPPRTVNSLLINLESSDQVL